MFEAVPHSVNRLAPTPTTHKESFARSMPMVGAWKDPSSRGSTKKALSHPGCARELSFLVVVAVVASIVGAVPRWMASSSYEETYKNMVQKIHKRKPTRIDRHIPFSWLFSLSTAAGLLSIDSC